MPLTRQRSIPLKIVPTELELALFARHMVAPAVLDDYDAALRAVLATLSLLPDLKLAIFLTLAAPVHLKSHLSAIHADVGTTLASCSVSTLFRLTDV